MFTLIATGMACEAVLAMTMLGRMDRKEEYASVLNKAEVELSDRPSSGPSEGPSDSSRKG